MAEHWIFGGEDNTPDGLAEHAELADTEPRQDGHEGCRTAFQRDLQGLSDEVADRRAEIERLREALGVLADAYEWIIENHPQAVALHLPFIRARALLSGREATDA